MGRQYLRNRPRSTPAAPTTARIDGWPVTVAGDAVSTWAAAADGPHSGLADLHTPTTVAQVRDQIGVAGLRQAAIDAGRKPPSARTVRRWVQQDRVPHPDVAELAQRRALVQRNGGISGVAAAMGVSESTVSRFQTGETKSLRPTTQRGLDEVRATDTLVRGGIATADGTLQRRPIVTVQAAYEYRNGGKTSSDYRTSRTFEIEFGDAAKAEDFAAAVARKDHAAAIALLERHLTLDYATTFDDFDDATGFHMEEVLGFEIDWR